MEGVGRVETRWILELDISDHESRITYHVSRTSIATGEQPSKRRKESEGSLLIGAGCGRRSLTGDGIQRAPLAR